MNKNIGLGILILLVGVGVGYGINSKKAMPSSDVSSGVHSVGLMGGTGSKGMAAGLEGKKGEELEVAFLEGMIEHHRDAVNMAHKIKEGSKRPELQKLADDIIGAQNSEVELMKGWLNQWYGR